MGLLKRMIETSDLKCKRQTSGKTNEKAILYSLPEINEFVDTVEYGIPAQVLRRRVSGLGTPTCRCKRDINCSII